MGKRKRIHLKPKTSIVRSPAKLPTRYDFVPNPTSENVPPPALKINRKPSVKDYHPPMHIFNSPTGVASHSAHPQRPATSATPAALTARPSGASPSVSANPAVQPHRASPTPQFRAPASSVSGNRLAPTPQNQPAHSPQVQPSVSPSYRQSHSPHSSHATAPDEDEEEVEYSDGDAPIQPNLSEDLMEALNSILLGPRPSKITFLDPDLLEPNSTW